MSHKYEALAELRFGDEYISPGQPVPEEEGRDYAALLRLGLIREVPAAPGGQGAALEVTLGQEKLALSLEEAAAKLQELYGELEQARATVAELSRLYLDATGAPLPDDFPGREHLIKAGIRVVELVPTTAEGLEALEGIGKKTAERILEALGLEPGQG